MHFLHLKHLCKLLSSFPVTDLWVAELKEIPNVRGLLPSSLSAYYNCRPNPLLCHFSKLSLIPSVYDRNTFFSLVGWSFRLLPVRLPRAEPLIYLNEFRTLNSGSWSRAVRNPADLQLVSVDLIVLEKISPDLTVISPCWFLIFYQMLPRISNFAVDWQTKTLLVESSFISSYQLPSIFSRLVIFYELHVLVFSPIEADASHGILSPIISAYFLHVRIRNPMDTKITIPTQDGVTTWPCGVYRLSYLI